MSQNSLVNINHIKGHIEFLFKAVVLPFDNNIMYIPILVPNTLSKF